MSVMKERRVEVGVLGDKERVEHVEESMSGNLLVPATGDSTSHTSFYTSSANAIR